jgi:hypothetical protein
VGTRGLDTAGAAKAGATPLHVTSIAERAVNSFLLKEVSLNIAFLHPGISTNAEPFEAIVPGSPLIINAI